MVKSLIVVFLLSLALLLTSCGDKRHFTIDNPTSQSIEVTIDDTTYILPPKSERRIALQPGSHRLISDITGEVEFNVYPTQDVGGIINPTLSTYVKVDEAYPASSGAAQQKPLAYVIALDGVPFEGSFTRYDSFYIVPDWAYGVHDEWPERAALSARGTIVTKLLFRDDFIAYYEQTRATPGYYASSLKVPDIQDIRDSLPPILPNFDNPEIQAATQPLRELARDYIAATDPKAQRRYVDAWYETSRQLALYEAENGARLTEGERLQLAAFKVALRKIRSKPLLLVAVVAPPD